MEVMTSDVFINQTGNVRTTYNVIFRVVHATIVAVEKQ